MSEKLKNRIKVLEEGIRRALTANPKCLSLQYGLPHCQIIHPGATGCWICHLKQALDDPGPDLDQALKLVCETTENKYPIRWTTCPGDFPERDFTIDVFNIESKDQRPFLRKIEPIRQTLMDLVGSRCIFIFHTAAATKEHYTL